MFVFENSSYSRAYANNIGFGGAGFKTEQKFSCGGPSFSQFLAKVDSDPCLWLGHKIIALPAAVWSATIEPIYHLTAGILSLLCCCLGNGLQSFKANMYKIPRDFEEALGRIVSFFHEEAGMFLVEEAQFYKRYYESFSCEESFSSYGLESLTPPSAPPRTESHSVTPLSSTSSSSSRSSSSSATSNSTTISQQKAKAYSTCNHEISSVVNEIQVIKSQPVETEEQFLLRLTTSLPVASDCLSYMTDKELLINLQTARIESFCTHYNKSLGVLTAGDICRILEPHCSHPEIKSIFDQYNKK